MKSRDLRKLSREDLMELLADVLEENRELRRKLKHCCDRIEAQQAEEAPVVERRRLRRRSA